MPFLDDPALAAQVALLAILPLLWAAISDLRRMEIPDGVHFALLGLFVLWAVLFLTPGEAGVRVLQGLAMMVVGLAMHFALGMGGGDMKLMAAAAPFVAPWERSFTLFALCLFMIVMTLAVIALRRALAGRGVETGWHALKREEAQFPFGVPIACAVAAALWLAARVAGG